MAFNNYLTTYDPKDVTFLVGSYQVTGFTEGTGISINREANLIEKKVGINGKFSLSKNRNDTGTATISLQATSEDNHVFEAWVFAAKQEGTPVIFPVTLIDPAGAIVASSIAWVETQADFSVEEGVSDREWTLGLGDVSTFPANVVGGIGAIAAAVLS